MNTNQQHTTQSYDPHENSLYNHRFIHLFKAIGFGFLRVLCPFLPGIAFSVLIWALATGQGTQSTLGATMGIVTGLMSLDSIPEFDSRMWRHWSIYQLLSNA